MAEQAEAMRHPVVNPNLWAGVTSAGVGMLGLLLSDALWGMDVSVLAVFLAADVLLPLFVLTFRPDAPVGIFGLFAVLYLAALTGFVAVLPAR